MIGPENKTCYRCGAGLPALVDTDDVRAGISGRCEKCRIALEAETAARNARFGIPRENISGDPAGQPQTNA